MPRSEKALNKASVCETCEKNPAIENAQALISMSMPNDIFRPNPRPVTVDGPIGYDHEWLTLAASDAEGRLRIRVDLRLWEDLRMSAPDWSDDGDRREYALAEVQWRASLLPPFITEDGRLIELDFV